MIDSKEKPNFIIVFCDDLGYGDLSCFGHPTIKTPHLDKMANEGQKWTNFYVSSSVSSPSRAGLITGRLGVRTGMYGNEKEVLFPDSPGGLPSDEYTIADILKQQGYTTACVGKWHLGVTNESMPLNKGFDYFYGLPYSNDMSQKEQSLQGNTNYRFHLPFYNQEEIIEIDPDQTQFTKRLTEYAIKFIEKEKNNPFFIYLTHPMPHIPLYSSADFQDKSLRGKYGDAVEEIDWSVGQNIETLRKNELDDNTLIIFTSDNGPWITYGIDGGSAGLLNDGKASTYEGGYRVPCIVWGGMVKSSLITDLGSTLDLLPTFCDMAGISLPTDRVYDGMSLYNTISQNGRSSRKVMPFFRGSELYAYRKGDYKIHFIIRPAYGSKEKTVLEKPLLFNINTDPGELYNISEQYPDIVKQLTFEAKEYVSSISIKKSIFDQ